MKWFVNPTLDWATYENENDRTERPAVILVYDQFQQNLSKCYIWNIDADLKTLTSSYDLPNHWIVV